MRRRRQPPATGTKETEMKHTCTFEYETFATAGELPEADCRLVEAARTASLGAHAPYSGFRVGAAARLADGTVITASNQESEVFPAGLCAERVLLFSHMSDNPGMAIECMAVATLSSDRECFPCGGCRQVIADACSRQGATFRLLMAGRERVIALDDATALLPLSFSLAAEGRREDH